MESDASTEPILKRRHSSPRSRIILLALVVVVCVILLNIIAVRMSLPQYYPVICLAVSPDGKTVASGSGKGGSPNPGEIKLWNTLTYEQVASLRGHESWVTEIAFSPDGQTLVSGGMRGGNVKFWDVVSGREIAAFTAHRYQIRSVVFSPDGKILVSCGDDESIKIWDTITKKRKRTLKGHADSLAFSADGQILASGTGHSVELWNPKTGKHLSTLSCVSWVFCLDFSPKGQTLAVGHQDGSVTLWDVGTKQQINSMFPHKETVSCIMFSPDGKRLATGSWDGSVTLVEVATGREIARFRQGSTIKCIAFVPDDEILVSGHFDGAIVYWDLTTQRERISVYGHRK